MSKSAKLETMGQFSRWLATQRRAIVVAPDKYLLATLIFLLPLDRIPSWQVFGLTLRLSFVVAAVIIIRALYLVMKNYRTARPNLAIVILLLFLAWIVVIIPVSVNLKRAVEVAGSDILVALTAIAVAYLYKPAYLPTLLRSLLWSAGLIGLFGIYQYFGNLAGLSSTWTGLRERYGWEQFGFPRIQSTMLEPLYYAAYLLIPIAVASALWLSRPRAWSRSRYRWLAGLLVLLLSSVFLTVSRGGILALAITLAGVALVLWWQHSTTLLRIGQLVLLTIVSAAIAVLMISYVSKIPLNVGLTHGRHGASAYTHQLATTTGEGSNDERTAIWHQAIEMVRASRLKALIGHGPGQFGPLIQHNQRGSGWFIVNNLTLELLVEEGAVGLLLFAIFIVTLLWQALRRLRREPASLTKATTAALLIYVVAIMVQYQTFSTLYIIYIWTAIGLLLGLIGYGKGNGNGKSRAAAKPAKR